MRNPLIMPVGRGARAGETCFESRKSGRRHLRAGPRRKTLHPETVRILAEDILENGMKTPIQVRHDGKRHVLVEGLHRLEAAKWLGETTIDAYLVQARRH